MDGAGRNDDGYGQTVKGDRRPSEGRADLGREVVEYGVLV